MSIETVEKTEVSFEVKDLLENIENVDANIDIFSIIVENLFDE